MGQLESLREPSIAQPTKKKQQQKKQKQNIYIYIYIYKIMCISCLGFDRDSNDFWGTYLENKMKPHDWMLISLYTFEKMWGLNCPFMSDLMLDPLLMLMMRLSF